MRWPWRWWRKPRPAPDGEAPLRGSPEARDAHARALADLAATHRRWERIRPTAAYLREAGRRNHFSEAILDAFRAGGH